jgi:large conductance mechanosensitive channel
MFPGDEGYESWAWQVDDKTIPYGKFIGPVVNFLVVVLVLYLFIVKFLGWIMRSRQERDTGPGCALSTRAAREDDQ